MLIVFFGTDRGGVRDAATAYIDKNLPPDGTLTTIDAVEYQEGQLADALGAASLFGGSEWFVFDTPSDNEEMEAVVVDSLSEMAESPNTFVILEGPLLAAVKKAYAKHAAEIEECATKNIKKFNNFALADALAQKDKRKLWVLLQECKLNGMQEENIIGILWWQLKVLRLAKQTRSADEAGMSDFPYSKAKRALSKFTDGEVEQLSQSLLQLYHDGHAGLRELDVALETWILKV